jgi:hypothetical protein
MEPVDPLQKILSQASMRSTPFDTLSPFRSLKADGRKHTIAGQRDRRIQINARPHHQKVVQIDHTAR